MAIITASNKSKTPTALFQDALPWWDFCMQTGRGGGSEACLEVVLSDSLPLAEETTVRLRVWGCTGEQRGG